MSSATTQMWHNASRQASEHSSMAGLTVSYKSSVASLEKRRGRMLAWSNGN
jgi:hypothetical protein